MNTHECRRCEHRWIGRLSQPPVQCPKCKSPYWDVPRKYDRLVKQVVKAAPAGADRVDFYHNGVHDGSVRISAKPEDIPGVTRGFPEPEPQAAKNCKACGEAMESHKGFWVCMDLTGCAMGGQQQGKAE